MNVVYTVHSVCPTSVDMPVELNGQTVTASVPCVVVELDTAVFSHTFTFTDPADIADAQTWTVGQTITFTKA